MPLPAIALGLASKFISKFKSSGARTRDEKQMVDQLVSQAIGGDAAALTELKRYSTHAAKADRRAYGAAGVEKVKVALSTKAVRRVAAQPELLQLANSRAGQTVASTLVREVVRAAKPKARRRLAGYDVYGQPMYRTVRARAPRQPLDELDELGAAGPAVSRAGARGLSGAAKAGIAIAAGTLAYFGARAVLRKLADQSLSPQKAGVQAALAFRQARADFKAERGRAPTADEVRAMGVGYKKQLVALGYDPVTFTKKKNAVQRFLVDYTPEEED
jgi:hypothetical protein